MMPAQNFTIKSYTLRKDQGLLFIGVNSTLISMFNITSTYNENGDLINIALISVRNMTINDTFDSF